jgi:predicted transposase YdaD
MYDSNLKAKLDYENSIPYAGERGEHKKALDIARKMKEDSIPVAQIAKFTSLPIEEIEKL